MKMIELRQKSDEESTVLMRTKQARIDELRFSARQHKVKNVKEIAGLKKDIARIRTLMQENRT